MRDSTTDLVFHHSSRVFWFGSLQGPDRGLRFDPELLYLGAMFHDLGLDEQFRDSGRRFEVDSADEPAGSCRPRRARRQHSQGLDGHRPAQHARHPGVHGARGSLLVAERNGTELKQVEGRGHSLTIKSGWDEVTEATLE